MTLVDASGGTNEVSLVLLVMERMRFAFMREIYVVGAAMFLMVWFHITMERSLTTSCLKRQGDAHNPSQYVDRTGSVVYDVIESPEKWPRCTGYDPEHWAPCYWDPGKNATSAIILYTYDGVGFCFWVPRKVNDTFPHLTDWPICHQTKTAPA